jgi:hypothetical protein
MGTALDQAPRRRPLPEGDRIVQGRPPADDRSASVDVGARASSASSASTSSLLAAQCSGASALAPEKRASTSAPAAAKAATFAPAPGTFPGQSVTTCRSVRPFHAAFDPPASCSAASVGCASSSALSSSGEPCLIACTTD